ncbi:MAG TPA: flagellar basal body and hook protein, partial [Lachnospiraceae bacterium]|nr:flagellar basal body and hook protein [Lachnospiraceae bacterium]
GMIEEQRRLDVLSNNLANSNTTGYKKEGTTNAAFDRQLALRIRDSGDLGFSRGLGDIQQGVKVGETYTDWSQGSFHITDEKSNLAIGGDGFFAIAYTDKQGNTSVKYTRDGEFTVDSQGYFRTANGDYLLDMNGATSGQISEANYVRVDPLQTYTVDELGNIWQNNTIVDTVGVVDVNNTDYLSKYGENLYDLVDGGSVTRGTNFQIEQGALETSNVNVVDEMVSMITIQRAYEAGQKVIQAEDETLDMATGQVGKV